MTKRICIWAILLWVQTFSVVAWGQPTGVRPQSENMGGTMLGGSGSPSGTTQGGTTGGGATPGPVEAFIDGPVVYRSMDPNPSRAERRRIRELNAHPQVPHVETPEERTARTDAEDRQSLARDMVSDLDHDSKQRRLLEQQVESQNARDQNLDRLMDRAGNSPNDPNRTTAADPTAAAPSATPTNATTSEPTQQGRLESDQARAQRIRTVNNTGPFMDRCKLACKNGEGYLHDFVEIIPAAAQSQVARNAAACDIAKNPAVPGQEAAHTAATTTCDQSCNHHCDLIARNGRDHEKSLQRASTGYAKRDDSGCSDAGLVLAANKFMSDAQYVDSSGRHFDRRAFYHCLNNGGGDANQAAGDFIRMDTAMCTNLKNDSDFENQAKCSRTKGLNTVSNATAMAATSLLSNFGQNSARTAQANVEAAQAKAAAGIETLDIHTTAINEAAQTLDKVEAAESTTAGVLGILGITTLIRSQQHSNTADRIAAARTSAGDAEATVGADDSGRAIQGGANAIIALNGTGAKSAEGAERANASGETYTQLAQQKHQEMADTTSALGAQLLIQAAQHSAQALDYDGRAAEMRRQRDSLSGPTADRLTTHAPPGGPGNDPSDLPPPINTSPLGNAGIQEGYAKAETDTNTTLDTGSGPGITPGPAGGGSPQGSLVGGGDSKPAGTAGFVAGQGGGQASGASTGGGGDGAREAAAEANAEDTLATHEKAKNMMLGSGGAAYAAANRGARKNDTGMDISGMLAQLLGKKGDAAKDGDASILDAAKNGRALAGNGQEGADIGDKNGNLFERASKVVSFAYKQGKLR